jgi:hypothetical protein
VQERNLNASLREKDISISSIFVDLKETRIRLNASLQSNEGVYQDRQHAVEAYAASEIAERKSFQNELKLLTEDLLRVRKGRDGIQKKLDNYISKEKIEVNQIEEINALSNARKDRITCLENDLVRLKMSYAAEIPEKALIDFFCENGNADPYKTLNEKLTFIFR